MTRTQRALLLALGAFAVATPGARPAGACTNEILEATDENVRAVKEADEKLNDGDPAEAAALLEKKLKRVSWHDMSVSFDRKNRTALLGNRALRIFALACVRLDGAIGPWGNAGPQQRKTNVQWGTNILKGITVARDGDAASKTDHAEALARTGGPEAKPKLEELAARDVLATPYAYAALAALRSSAGDAKGRDDALAKCKTMAAKKSICELPPPKPNG